MKNKIKKIYKIFLYLVIFLSFIIIFTTYWIKETFGLVDLDKLIFHLNVPLKGTGSEMIISYITKPLLIAILLLIPIFFTVNYNFKYKIFLKIAIFNKIKKEIYLIDIIKKYRTLFVIILFLFSIIIFCNELGVKKHIENLSTYSTFYEENYVDPKTAKITFPSKKRNLIHIFVESFEYTYASTENGGIEEENLIPNMVNYSKEYVSFTNSEGRGFLNSRSTGWTIAGMFAQTSGIGLNIPGNGNDFGKYSKFLPGAYSIGDILDANGYINELLIGSDATFGGRKEYFEQHGNYIIKDYLYAKEKEWIPNDYYVWWGYEDSKLFEFAKKELIELSKGDKPFNLTLLTTNTHHIDGYLEESCKIKYDEKFKNVISCTDNQLYELIEWIKEQDFYDDTTVVITGDHLSMDPEYFKNIDTNYNRTNFNLFINSVIEPIIKENRDFNSMDIYPTIVGSLGIEIEGNRLGLGTNLFSDKKTLYEEYGISDVEQELSKNSKYYKNNILIGKK